MQKLINSGYKCDAVNKRNARDEFPYLNIGDNIHGYFTPDHSGMINPRRLVEAQLLIARSHGCQHIKDAVHSVTKDNSGVYQVMLSSGDVVKTKNVILATGAYLNISGHLSQFTDQHLDLDLMGQTVAFLRVSDETAERLGSMPSVVTTYNYARLDGTYILPPVKYPDGKYYLKLGHHDMFERQFGDDPEEIREWYREGTGDKEAVEELTGFLENFIKDLEVEDVRGGCCITSHTKDREGPYIDKVVEGLFVAGGGCG